MGAAHPRSRGEHLISERAVADDNGSSPLTRGAHDASVACTFLEGLIPAHAGSTPTLNPSIRRQAAHPRSRGEHARMIAEPTCGLGSSPLTRGARVRLRPGQRMGRLIPAHAGSTCWRRSGDALSWAHPRSRGEHSGRGVELGDELGSSPLTRGARAGEDPSPGLLRLIPAHAGSTPATVTSTLGRPAHPRSRGEHLLSVREAPALLGSSPLTRGAR